MIIQSLHLLRTTIVSDDAIFVIANVFDNNIPSIATLSKCGFSKLYQKDNIPHHDIKPKQALTCDMHSYAILLQ